MRPYQESVVLLEFLLGLLELEVIGVDLGLFGRHEAGGGATGRDGADRDQAKTSSLKDGHVYLEIGSTNVASYEIGI